MPSTLAPWQRIPAKEESTGLWNVVIESSRDSRCKYAFDEDHGVYKLRRVLPSGMVFPHDFGSVPGTLAEDGDPLDMLVIANHIRIEIGCLVATRLLGVIECRQVDGDRSVRNDRLIGALVTGTNAPAISTLEDLAPEMLDQIEHFFVAYNAAQGRPFVIEKRSGVHRATAILKEGERAFATNRESAP